MQNELYDVNGNPFASRVCLFNLTSTHYCERFLIIQSHNVGIYVGINVGIQKALTSFNFVLNINLLSHLLKIIINFTTLRSAVLSINRYYQSSSSLLKPFS